MFNIIMYTPSSPHIHSVPPHGTHYELNELPLDPSKFSKLNELRELELPSSIHTIDPILQKEVFKPKYVKVKKFLLDG